MGITAAQLLVKVNADTLAAQQGLGGLISLLSPGGGLLLGAAAASAAVAGIGIAATKMAGDFQAGMTSLVTGAGESQANLKVVSDGILQMARDTGTSTQQLTDGMYMIESAGYHGKAGLDVLKAAAEGAKVGNADLGTVADAVTTVMKDYANQGVTAAQATNELVATVASGKTHMQDLSGALAEILPTASAARVGLNDVMGAMATMTSEGVPAANASTYLRQMILALTAPSSAAEKALKSVGLTTDQVATAMQTSLPGALKLITDAVGKKFPEGSAGYVAAIKEISGGAREMQGMLDLSGQHLNEFQSNVGGITDTVKKGGSSINGWNLVQQDFNYKVDHAKEVVSTFMVQLGTKLLPVAGQVVDLFATHFVPAVEAVSGAVKTAAQDGQRLVRFLQSTSPAADAVKIALVILGGAMLGFAASAIPAAITGIMASVTAFGAQAIAAGAAAVATLAAAAPFILIGAAIAAVAVGIYELIQHWSQVQAFFGNLKNLVGEALGHILETAKEWGLKLLELYTWPYREAWTLIQAAFARVKQLVATALADILGAFKWLYDHNTYVHDMVEGIKTVFADAKAFLSTALADIKQALSAAWKTIRDDAQVAWGWVHDHIVQPVTEVWTKLQDLGGAIGKTLRDAWTTVQTDVTSAWNTVMGFIGGLASRAAGAIKNGVVDPITNAVGGLATQALHWGENLITMLVQGITNTAGKVGDAAKNVAGNIVKFLGFHSPAEEGPAADADVWMPNLGKMLAEGLTGQRGAVGTAAQGLAAQVAQHLGGLSGLSGNASRSLGTSAPGGAPLALPLTVASYPNPAGLGALGTALGGSADTGQPQTIILQVDGRRMAEVTVKHLPSVVRNGLGSRGF